MISTYFTEPKFDLDKIPPVINLDDFKNNNHNFWYLKNHDYQPFVFCDNIFSDDEINQIIKFGNLYVEEQGQVGGSVGNIDINVRSCKLAWMFPNKHTDWIYQKITDLVNKVNEEAFKYDLTKLENFQFTKYRGKDNGFYEKHTDSMSGLHLPENRKLSLVVQLSGPEEYEGGDLCLQTGKYPTIIEKKKGRVVFFPSYTLHEVKPVTQGTRYTLVGWVHGPAFK